MCASYAYPISIQPSHGSFDSSCTHVYAGVPACRARWRHSARRRRCQRPGITDRLRFRARVLLGTRERGSPAGFCARALVAAAQWVRSAFAASRLAPHTQRQPWRRRKRFCANHRFEFARRVTGARADVILVEIRNKKLDTTLTHSAFHASLKWFSFGSYPQRFRSFCCPLLRQLSLLILHVHSLPGVASRSTRPIGAGLRGEFERKA